MAEAAEPELGISDIPAPRPAPDGPADERVTEELADIQRAHELHRATRWQAMAALRRVSYQQDVAARRSYAAKIFWLVVGWLGIVFALLVACGIKRPATTIGFELSDKVLLAIIAGTTVDVIGLFAIVANYLFYKPSKRVKRRLRTGRDE